MPINTDSLTFDEIAIFKRRNTPSKFYRKHKHIFDFSYQTFYRIIAGHESSAKNIANVRFCLDMYADMTEDTAIEHLKVITSIISKFTNSFDMRIMEELMTYCRTHNLIRKKE